jgi:hypothetical protein
MSLMNNNSVTTPNFVNSKISSNDVVTYGLQKTMLNGYIKDIQIPSRGIYTAYMWPYDPTTDAISRDSCTITFYADPGVGYKTLQNRYGLGSSIIPIINASYLSFTGQIDVGWFYYLLQKIASDP